MQCLHFQFELVVVSSSRLSSLSLTVCLTHFHLSSAQLYHFHQENNKVVLLAKMQFVGYDVYYRNINPPRDLITSNDLNGIHFLLLNLNQINGLSFKYHWHIPEHELFKEFVSFKSLLNMITTLFDPNQFGGGFFYKGDGTSTIFTDSN